MALYTAKTPNADNFSKNPVEFTIGTTSTPTDAKQLGYSLQMQNYSTMLWEEVYEGIQRFDSNGQSELDISRICDAHLEYYVAKPYDTSVTTSKFIIWRKQARNFRLQFWETDDKVATLTQSSSFYVLKGGVAKEQWDKIAVDDYYFDSTNLRFLTNNQIAFRDQGILFVQFYAPAGTSATKLVRTTIGSSTGITNYTISGSIVENTVFTFFIDISTITDDVHTISFGLEDGSGSVSESLVYSISTRKYNYSRIYACINSIGGTDLIYLPYNQIKQTEQTRDTFSRLDSSVPGPYTMEVSAESFQTNQTEELVTAIDAGELSAAMQDRMRDFTLSPARYELIWSNLVDGSLKYVPVNVLTKKNTLSNYKNRAPVPLYFEITRAIKNLQYTPANTDYNGALTNDKWTGISAPVEDYCYMTIAPLDSPAQFAFTPNAKVFVDYGDNTSATVSTATTHTYADNKIRKITLGFLLKDSLNSLSITSHGKVNKIWGVLPFTISTFKCNTQALTAAPALPAELHTLEIKSNLLTLVPELPPIVVTVKLDSNVITAFDVQDIPVTVVYLDLSSNLLPVAVVNYVLQKLDTNGASNGTVIINNQTPAAAPTGAGATAKTNLLGKGWTVTTD